MLKYCISSSTLYHGCARVAHCVTARWRNISHYCRPLRQYDVWITCSEHREALTAAPTTHVVHKVALTVQGRSTQFATEQVGRVCYVTTVDGGLKRLSLCSVICAPVLYTFIILENSPQLRVCNKWNGHIYWFQREKVLRGIYIGKNGSRENIMRKVIFGKFVLGRIDRDSYLLISSTVTYLLK